jgi:hypothetical protein
MVGSYYAKSRKMCGPNNFQIIVKHTFSKCLFMILHVNTKRFNFHVLLQIPEINVVTWQTVQSNPGKAVKETVVEFNLCIQSVQGVYIHIYIYIYSIYVFRVLKAYIYIYMY